MEASVPHEWYRFAQSEAQYTVSGSSPPIFLTEPLQTELRVEQVLPWLPHWNICIFRPRQESKLCAPLILSLFSRGVSRDVRSESKLKIHLIYGYLIRTCPQTIIHLRNCTRSSAEADLKHTIRSFGWKPIINLWRENRRTKCRIFVKTDFAL